MKIKETKRRIFMTGGLFTVIGLTLSCNQLQNPAPTAPTAPPPNANAAAPAVNANSAPKAAAPEVKAIQLPVTLPVLDAMFYDQAFTDELKNNLQLSDDQIGKIKNTASQAVANLGEAEEDSGSTRIATKKASEQIQAIIGADKTAQLFDLVQSRWSSGEIDAATGTASAPNALPTDTRIVVNAPAYRMDVFQDGKLLKTYKIGIGYPEFPLPNALRKAETIIFNPTWTPPDEPWVKGKVSPGKKVEAGSTLNPLGPIKIPIGLPSLIHGGKVPARLGTFASHGCVGLTNAQVQDFSLTLAQISGTQLTPEDVKGYEKNKTETKNIKLTNAVPVELRYETIVVENGKLKIYRDVYEKGTNTEENLRKVLDGYGVSFDSLTAADKTKIMDALKLMNTDSQGNEITVAPEAKASPGKPETNSNADNSGKVTRTIKGKKEIEIVLPQLAGKGFPAPVALNSGQ